jgi:hypothetical protein
MLCLPPTPLKQRAPNTFLLRHGRKPSREADSFIGQLQPPSASRPFRNPGGFASTRKRTTFLATASYASDR